MLAELISLSSVELTTPSLLHCAPCPMQASAWAMCADEHRGMVGEFVDLHASLRDLCLVFCIPDLRVASDRLSLRIGHNVVLAGRRAASPGRVAFACRNVSDTRRSERKA